MRIGIDLGGTKIEAALLDEAGAIVQRRRIATPRGAYGPILEAIAGLVGQVAAPGASIGVGIPGSLAAGTGLVRNANTTELNGRPLAQDLAATLGRPVRESGRGYACIAELRMVETIRSGAAVTPFLKHGDTVRINAKDAKGHSVFGAIEQRVSQHC